MECTLKIFRHRVGRDDQWQYWGRLITDDEWSVNSPYFKNKERLRVALHDKAFGLGWIINNEEVESE